MGKLKHPRKGVKMDRTTEDVATPVPPEIIENYKNIHLDIDLIFVKKNTVPFGKIKRYWIYSL